MKPFLRMRGPTFSSCLQKSNCEKRSAPHFSTLPRLLTVYTAPSQPVTAHSLLCSTPSQVLARSRPELFFSGLWRSRDEVHLMLDSALQWIFLTLNDSSFSEHFYGIKRVQWGAGAGLSTKQMTVSFVCLVLVPYLKVKVERLHSVLTDENETLGMWAWQDCRTPTQLLKLLLFKSIPYLQSLWTLCHLVFRLNYLIRSSPHYSPLHWLAGVKLVHYQATDVSEKQKFFGRKV
ncbi:Peroxisome assembly protein 12, partial [Geodia barretti]